MGVQAGRLSGSCYRIFFHGWTTTIIASAKGAKCNSVAPTALGWEEDAKQDKGCLRKTRPAELLGISPKTLHNKLNLYRERGQLDEE